MLIYHCNQQIVLLKTQNLELWHCYALEPIWGPTKETLRKTRFLKWFSSYSCYLKSVPYNVKLIRATSSVKRDPLALVSSKSWGTCCCVCCLTHWHTACGCVRDVFFSWIQDLHLSKSLFTATVPSQCHMIHTSSTIAGTNSSLSHLQDSCRRCWESHTFPTYPLILHRTHHTMAPLWWLFLLLHIDKFFINKKSDLYKDVAAISCKYAQSATRFILPPRKRSYFCCYIASLHSIKLKMLLLAS